jgi:hypothetical protein
MEAKIAMHTTAIEYLGSSMMLDLDLLREQDRLRAG